MPAPRTRPDHAGDEQTQLLGWLNLQRSVIHWKAEGLSDADAHRPVLPRSPLLTMAGLVSHLRWTEHLWFEVVMENHPSEGNPQFVDEPEDADMIVDGVPLADLLDRYDEQCAVTDAIVRRHAMDDLSRHPAIHPGATLRWILLHMLEETARHAGHADAIRELIDGERGYY